MINPPAMSGNESLSSKGDSQGNKSIPERGFESFASATRKFHMSNVLMIEKLSIIVKKYFESKPLIKKQSQEIEILIQYNKQLIETLNAFEAHESKLITRLRRMEEMNLEYMREYCLIKGKPVNLPKPYTYEPIFANFSLTKLHFKPQSPEPPEVDLTYKSQLVRIMKEYYLTPELVIEKNIREHMGKVEANSAEEFKLKELLSKIELYNQLHANFKEDKAFDMLELKAEIRRDLEEYFEETGNNGIKPNYNQEERFISEVIKFHAELEEMSEPMMVSFLKEERQIRQRLEKEKIKVLKVYEEEFGRLEIEHNYQKQEMARVKMEKNSIEKEFKEYKNRREVKRLRNRSSNMSRMNESHMDLDMSRRTTTNEGQVDSLEKALLDKMAELDETKRNLVEMEERLQEKIRILIQENEELRKRPASKKEVEQPMPVEEKIPIPFKKEKSLVLSKIEEHGEEESEVRVGQIIEPKNVASFLQQTSFKEIQLEREQKYVQTEELIQKSLLKPEASKSESSDHRDEDIMMSPMMPPLKDVKDVQFIWNSYNSALVKDEESPKLKPEIQDQDRMALVIKRLEMKIQEQEKVKAKKQDIIVQRNAELVEKELKFQKEVSKLSSKIEESQKKYNGLCRKQDVVEHLTVTVYCTVGLIESLESIRDPIRRKLSQIKSQLEAFMEEYQIKFEKDIRKGIPGFYNDLSVEVGSWADADPRKAYSLEVSNVDIIKEMVEAYHIDKRKNEKPIKLEAKPDSKAHGRIQPQVHFDSSKKNPSYKAETEEYIRESLKTESRKSSLVRIPRMRDSQDLFELSSSRNVESEKKKELEEVSFNLSNEIEEIPRSRTHHISQGEIQLGDQLDEMMKEKAQFDFGGSAHILAQKPVELVREVIKEVYIKSDPESDYAELYGKYKQAISSLEQEQKKSRDYEIRYQRFVKNLLEQNSRNKDVSMEQKLFHLERLVREQHETIETERKEYNETFKNYHMEFQNSFKSQIRALRNKSDIF